MTGGGGATGPVGSRKEMGDSESSQRDRPHLDKNMEDAALQEDHPSPGDVAGLPATAHGKDKLPESAQDSPIDPTSMYDHRPEESKHWEP